MLYLAEQFQADWPHGYIHDNMPNDRQKLYIPDKKSASSPVDNSLKDMEINSIVLALQSRAS